MLKGWVLIAAGLLFAGIVMAEEGDIAYLPSGTDIKNTESLQRGARNFMNYCSGCHSLKYVRYNRMATDLEIPEAELQANLMFTSEKPYDTVNTSMPADAEAWFGKQPPDLSLMARARSVDYIYGFLKGFYVDKARPWGTNNLVLPGTAMPPVLSSLQGLQKPVFKNEPDEHGSANMVLVDFHPDPGKALVDGPQALLLSELPYFLEDVGIAREAYLRRVDAARRHRGG
jgi:ubiquinol-cytochrome c reductase cytochrome c1 subunit